MIEEEKNIYQEGQVLLVNKPLDWTSFHVVKKVNYLLKGVKVGHAGTLDPLATGLLILCTGKFTKRISEFMAQEKEYTGSITLGAITPSYDLETAPVHFKDTTGIDIGKVKLAAAQLTGEILQVPPAFSAIKKEGQRAYALARKGIDVQLQARKITIKEFDILSLESNLISFRVVCSTGTYIRSLAQDLGQLAGCGAYLSSLCRTRIGAYSLEEALTMSEVEQSIKAYALTQNG
jgi:tRNA pseudouridine55 synthase